MKLNIYRYYLNRLLFILLLQSPFLLFAQTPTFSWAGRMGANNPAYPGGTNWNWGNSIALDDSGNVYVVGQFLDTVDFDPGPNVYNLISAQNNYDAFVCKWDSQGNLVWAKRIGGDNTDYGRAVALDTLGNVYVAGDFSGNVDFDPGAGVYNLSSKGDIDVFITKLTNQGNFIWAKDMGGISGDYIASIAVDAQGDVYAAGDFLDSADFDPGPGVYNLVSAGGIDIFISKLDSSGNFEWAKRLGGASSLDGSEDITLDAAGNVYTTGEFGSTVDFDPGSGIFNLTAAGQADIYINKLDAQGNFIWAVAMGGGCWEGGYSIAVDNAGNVYTTGQFECTADLDPGQGVFNLTASFSSGDDIFLSKLNSQGDFVWAKNMGGSLLDGGESIKLDACNNIYITGEFGDTVDFDPGPATHNLISAGNWDVFIGKYDQQGNYIWAERMGGDSMDNGYALAINNSGDILTTGYFSATSDFDPGSGVYNLTATGGEDIFVQKIKQDSIAVFAAQASANAPICAGDTLKLAASGGNSFAWSGPNGFSTNQQNPMILNADTSATGLYSVTVSKGGCSEVVAIYAEIKPLPVINLSSNSPICAGKTLTLFASGGIAYQWTGPSGFNSVQQNPVINPAAANNSGIYSVSVSGSNSCVDSADIMISVNPNFKDTIIADICQGESYTLGNQNYSSAGFYTDTFYSYTGCDSIVTVDLRVHESPEVQISSEVSGTLCIGEAISLKGSGGARYHWWSNTGKNYGDNQEATVTLSQPHNVFWLAGFNQWNCSDTAQIAIDARNCCQLFIPNAFTPNGDGKNDVFSVKTLAPPESFRLEIYNRWGQIVFFSYDVNGSWNGTFNGKPVDAGTYFYHVSGRCINGEPIGENGSVNLLR